jgi:hypothetical protein
MKITRDSISKTITGLLESGARRATFYLAEDAVVTATHQRKPDKRSKSQTIILTIGKPNYLGRQFVKACKKAGEPFPVKRLQLKFWK